MNLVVASSALEGTVAQSDMIDAEDLRREMERCVAQVVQHNPELAISAARQLGWTITPPNQDFDEGSCDT